MGFYELFCELNRFFYELFYELFCDIGGVVRDIFYDIGAVVEIPEGYVELGGVGTELWSVVFL